MSDDYTPTQLRQVAEGLNDALMGLYRVKRTVDDELRIARSIADATGHMGPGDGYAPILTETLSEVAGAMRAWQQWAVDTASEIEVEEANV